MENGINRALIQTLLEQSRFSISLEKLREYVQIYNQGGYRITYDDLVEKLKKGGYHKEPTQIKPDELELSKKPPPAKRKYPNDDKTGALATGQLNWFLESKL